MEIESKGQKGLRYAQTLIIILLQGTLSSLIQGRTQTKFESKNGGKAKYARRHEEKPGSKGKYFGGKGKDKRR